jgi:type IV pilus assembly protein PilQ
MSINMQDSDIKNVLMLIGELTGLNIVVSPSVRDTITANLENVSVKAALDVILKPNGYGYFTQENIIIVKGADSEIVRELETIVLKLKYINSDDLAGPLGAVLSGQGRVQSFTPVVTAGAAGVSNVVIISDVQERIPNILRMVEELDKPIPNINISVRFIESGVDSAKGSGIDWSMNTPIFLGGTEDTTGSLLPFKLNNMTIATLNPFQFGQAWKLMQARGESKILASPQLTTLDNHEAETQITTTIYIEGSVSNMSRNNSSNNNTSSTNTSANTGGYNNISSTSRQVTEKDVGIELQVTPRINDENRITLLVNASVEALLSSAEVMTDKPRSTRRTVRTQVTVNVGDTVIIGGLIAENAIENRKFVPVLSDLPFIGKIFQSTSIDKEQRELLIFITPNIVG